jgi:hypothetical protein
MTPFNSAGLKESDFEKVAAFIDRGIKIALEINAVGDNSKKLKSFQAAVKEPNAKIEHLKEEVTKFASAFFMP